MISADRALWASRIYSTTPTLSFKDDVKSKK
jgi:hypothetical protein